MEMILDDSVTRSHSTSLLLFVIFILCTFCVHGTAIPQELRVGFKAQPDSSAQPTFQPILTDPTGNFSLGFLRLKDTSHHLTLAVTHLASLQPLWQPPTQTTFYSYKTLFSFNGSLVISDPETGSFWSSPGAGGDTTLLLLNNNSNLQILSQNLSIWESFDYPQNTLVQTQNFTSAMTLVSPNGIYSMKLGGDYMAMYARFNPGKDQIYWRHEALQVKADVAPEKGPIYARVDPDGFLGMYQTGTDPPVDIQAFNSFNRPVNGFLIVRLEDDGNLKGYYWDGAQWVLDYQAISGTCELPSTCGAYGLCQAGSCSCLDNRTEFRFGQCSSGETTGDFCSGEGFWTLRREGVELPFKELMGYETVSSSEECEGVCERNCSCWGAVFNNGSGFCYLVDYPIRTVLGVNDPSKVGYFKVRKGAGKKMDDGLGIGLGVLGGALSALVGVACFAGYKLRIRKRGVTQILEDGGFSPGPYRNLGSASFKSIEMCTSGSSRR